MSRYKAGLQIACITYWGNWRARVAEWRANGYIVVLCDGHARVHQAVR